MDNRRGFFKKLAGAVGALCALPAWAAVKEAPESAAHPECLEGWHPPYLNTNGQFHNNVIWPGVVHVDAKRGNDKNPGSYEKPVATVDAALKRAEEINAREIRSFHDFGETYYWRQ